MKVHAWSWGLFLENHRHFHLQDVIQPLSQVHPTEGRVGESP